jgi:hypothetical protein
MGISSKGSGTVRDPQAAKVASRQVAPGDNYAIGWLLVTRRSEFILTISRR